VTGLRPVDVAALVDRVEGGVDRAGHTTVRFEGGALASISATWRAVPAPDLQLTVLGEGGTLHLDGRTPLTLIPAVGEARRLPLPGDTGCPLAELLAAARGERAPTVDARQGRDALAVVEAAFRSAAEGRAVRLI
jgi:predicted dehydrogenase